MKTAQRTTYTRMLSKHGIPAHHTVIVVDRDGAAIWGSGKCERGARNDATRWFNLAGCGSERTLEQFHAELETIELV